MLMAVPMPMARARKRRPATTDAPPAAPPPDAVGPDDDADEPERGPLRRCIVTRERLAKEQMIRFVVLPAGVPTGGVVWRAGKVSRAAGTVVPDLTATLPGRGIWLSARGDVLETARTRGGFARAARGAVTVSPDLTSELAAALTRRIAETLGLARRAGQAVAGFSKAREWLTGGRAGAVVQASDGSPEERRRFVGGWNGRVPVVLPLDATQLGGVFGRDHVVHVVLLPGRLAERVCMESARLAGVRNTLPVAIGATAPTTTTTTTTATMTTGPAAAPTTTTDDAPGAAGAW